LPFSSTHPPTTAPYTLSLHVALPIYAHFYEALVDRPQLKYILTPHEGPGAAMAAGYVKASGEPSIVMQAAVVGLANAMGQMFNRSEAHTSELQSRENLVCRLMLEKKK